VNVGWEDVFIGRTGLTVSGEYQAALIASVQLMEQNCVTMCVLWAAMSTSRRW